MHNVLPKQRSTIQDQRKKEKKQFKVPAERFDPNQLDLEGWMQLGLSKKQAEVVLNFAKRGLKSNEDLKKVFVLSDEFIDAIKDSTYYPEGKLYKRERDAVTATDTRQLFVPVNEATEEQLMDIPGIGPFYAKKIVEYRGQLGGYVQKEQLMEIWKLDVEKFEEIRNFIQMDQTEIKKISLNEATIDELKAHPYISYSIANSIVKLRKQHGDYERIDEIKRSKLINEVLYSKLEPYLSL